MATDLSKRASAGKYTKYITLYACMYTKTTQQLNFCNFQLYYILPVQLTYCYIKLQTQR